MHSNRSNPSQFRVSHLSRQSTVRLYCMAAVWYRYCNVWLLYGTNYCMVLYGYSCTAVLYGTVLVLYGYCMVPVLLYGCMVLYGCTAVWYCMGNILLDLAGSYQTYQQWEFLCPVQNVWGCIGEVYYLTKANQTPWGECLQGCNAKVSRESYPFLQTRFRAL